eukprot:7179713-Pyramimonas_sp.AAC.1
MSNDEVREYKSAVRDLHHALLGDKKIGDLKAAARRRMRDLKYPKKIFKTPIGHDDLPQAQAKLLLPPGATVWRGNQVGSWQVHVKPHPRHSERWAKHGNNSYNAMLAAVRFAWSQWLGDHMLDSKDCPIDGSWGGTWRPELALSEATFAGLGPLSKLGLGRRTGDSKEDLGRCNGPCNDNGNHGDGDAHDDGDGDGHE